MRYLPKALLLLMAWPVGITVIAWVIAEGLRQNPFVLAVHEMLFIIVSLVLMLCSLLFSTPSRKKPSSSATRQAFKFILIAAPSAFLTSIFLLIPIAQALPIEWSSQGQSLLVNACGVLIAALVLIGAVAAYKNAKAYPSAKG